jgi:hypothetical protein
MNSFVLRLPHVDIPEDIRVTWTIAGNTYERYIDQDDLDSTEYLYTFPVVVSGVTGLDVRVT